jgi:hypothetical protein
MMCRDGMFLGDRDRVDRFSRVRARGSACRAMTGEEHEHGVARARAPHRPLLRGGTRRDVARRL